ncbi:MAG: MFS transporter, partial [Flavobacteriales bacterium]|nr:MFS transporter [Flavobacteriales bacterium]
SKEDIIQFTPKEDIELEDKSVVNDYPINHDANIEIKANIFVKNGTVMFTNYENNQDMNMLIELDSASSVDLPKELEKSNATSENPLHARVKFEKDKEAIKIAENRGDGKDYGVSFVLEERQNDQEFKIFMWITIFTSAFGLLLIVFLKKLKKLTHGAEDNEGTVNEEAEGFELADGEIS